MAGPCMYAEGEKTPDGKFKCKFLEVDDTELGTYLCKLYSEIVAKESSSEYPMFGSGCSSTLFNDLRSRVIQKMRVLNHIPRCIGREPF